MWKRFIKTRCSVISYYWHKSSLVLSFPFRLFSKMFLLNRAKIPFLFAVKTYFKRKIGIYKKIVI